MMTAVIAPINIGGLSRFSRLSRLFLGFRRYRMRLMAFDTLGNILFFGVGDILVG